MRTVAFDLISTLLVSVVALFAGRALATRVPGAGPAVNNPALVIGGGLVAIVLTLWRSARGIRARGPTRSRSWARTGSPSETWPRCWTTASKWRPRGCAPARSTPSAEAAVVLGLAFGSPDYLAVGSAQGAKISKRTGLRGITIPLHPAATRYFGPDAPTPPPPSPPKR